MGASKARRRAGGSVPAERGQKLLDQNSVNVCAELDTVRLHHRGEMLADIRIGADAHSNQLLSLMRDGVCHGDLTNQLRFMPGLHLAADPALGISGTYDSPEGRILDFDIQTSGQGNWLGLHISFPQRDISRCGVIGFACRTSWRDTLPRVY